jgi:hypothetical protein
VDSTWTIEYHFNVIFKKKTNLIFLNIPIVREKKGKGQLSS